MGSQKSFAQVIDDFSDGDFTANPTWSGDTSQFAINSGKLQLNSSGVDSSYLSTSWAVNTINGMEWDVLVRQSFAPSSQNYGRVYLLSDQQNLEGSLHGYFLQFGESGSTDALELFVQDGYSITSVARGTSGLIAASFEVSVKVYRDSSGNWNIFSDYTGGKNYQLEASGNNTQFQQGICFGIKCVYTSGNATKFYFDDFYVGPLILDTIPPSLVQVNAINANAVDLIFDEAVDLSQGTFSVDQGIGNANQMVQDPVDSSLIHLSFTNSLISGNQYLLTATSIGDGAGNILSTTSFSFRYLAFSMPLSGDLLITELMPDPSGAAGLPEAEYVEIFNSGNSYFNTEGWQITDGSTTGILPSDTLAPGDFRVYLSSANAALFTSALIPNVRGLSSFPGLNNDGDHIRLLDQNNFVLDEITYTTSLYQDEIKAGGGWSLERMDLQFKCSDPLNWKASNDVRGGSPGTTNSLSTTFIDSVVPMLEFCTLEDSIHVLLHFSETPDVSTASIATNYRITNGIGVPKLAETIEGNSTIIRLTLNSPIVAGTVYEISVDETFQDCPGNKIGAWRTAKIGRADVPSAGNIILNEILFNAVPDGYDFVEIWNISDKIIDVNDLKIANADPFNGVLETIYPVYEESRLIFPGEYLALTDGPNFIRNTYHSNDPRTIFFCNLPSYTDEEGVVVLLDKSLKELDRFHYKQGFHFPLLNDVEGISLERISPFRISSDSTNWHSAAETAGFATPGMQNSQYQEGSEAEENLRVDPELFSPDNDGEKDILNLYLKVTKPGFYTSISIFDRSGKLVCRPAINELAGITSAWSWDGFTEEKEAAPVGIYIIYVEMIHPDGEVIHLRKPCVLAHRL